MMTMADKPPWDAERAVFFLIAGILAVHCVVVLTGLFFCVWYGDEIVASRYKCSSIGVSLGEILSGALAAALAMAAGARKKD